MTLDYFNQARNTARDSGNRIGQNFNKIDQGNKIEDILSAVYQSENPQESMNNAMTQILSTVDKENQPAVIKQIENIGQQMDTQRQRKAQTDIGINPDLPKYINERLLDREKGNTLAQQGKENRLQRSELSGYYKRLITNLKEGIEDGTLDPEKAKAISASLAKEEHNNRTGIESKKEPVFDAVNNYLSFLTPEESEEIPPWYKRIFGGGKAIGQEQEKVSFDEGNPEHIEIQNDILLKSGGDKEMANKLMNELFI